MKEAVHLCGPVISAGPCTNAADKHKKISLIHGHHITFQGLSAPPGLLLPGFAQIGIEPAAETVLLVPATLAVADQHQLVRGHIARSAGKRSQTQRECSQVTETRPRDTDERCWHGDRFYRTGAFGGRRLWMWETLPDARDLSGGRACACTHVTTRPWEWLISSS